MEMRRERVRSKTTFYVELRCHITRQGHQITVCTYNICALDRTLAQPTVKRLWDMYYRSTNRPVQTKNGAIFTVPADSSNTSRVNHNENEKEKEDSCLLT